MLIVGALFYAFAEVIGALADLIPDRVANFFFSCGDKISDALEHLHRFVSKKYRKQAEERDRREEEARKAAEIFLRSCEEHY